MRSLSAACLFRGASPLYRAFTLTEILVVICVIAILGTLLLSGAKYASKRVLEIKAIHNIRSAGQGMLLYAQDHNNRLPRGWRAPSTEWDNGVQQTWQEQVAPYIVGGTTSSSSSLRKLLRRTANSPLMDPGAPQPHNDEDMPSMGINANLNDGYWDGWKGYLSRVPHPSETILLGSRQVEAGSSDYLWSFNNPLWETINPGLYHRNKTVGIFAFVDGHVEVLSREVLTPGTSEANSRPELWRW